MTFKQKSKEARKACLTLEAECSRKRGSLHTGPEVTCTWRVGGQCLWNPVNKGRKEEGPHHAGLGSPSDTLALTLSKMGLREGFERSSDVI